MGLLKPGATYIYESPDGGETVYARESGSSITDRIMVGQSLKAKEQIERRLWTEIYNNRNINPTLQQAVDRVILIYKMSEEYERKN